MDPLAAAPVILDHAAIAVFGATGALAAARRNHDIVTFGFFAAVTGVGGGTLRDLLIGAPVFWVAHPGSVLACLAAAALIWLGGAAKRRCCGWMPWAWRATPASAPPRRCRWASRPFRR